MNRGDLNRIVRQHAQTSRLLGVDFVPVYRTGAEPTPESPPTQSEATTVSEATGPAPAFGEEVDMFASPTAEPVEYAPEEAQRLLDELRERYERDAPHAQFNTQFTNIVFGEGDPRARLMFIGEAPGAEEDRTGRPFVGRAGHLLDKMIEAMGLTRERVYIANVLKTRPPGNATPTTEESRLCSPYLFEQIRIIHPEVIVTLGLPATHLLLGRTDSMARLRAHWWDYRGVDGRVIPVMPTYHPAYLLRSYTRENRQKVWSDLTMVMDRLGLSRSRE